MRCHSVASFFSFVALSVHLSVAATEKLQTALPSGRKRVSGSLPRLPTTITLLIDAISTLLFGSRYETRGHVPSYSPNSGAVSVNLKQPFTLVSSVTVPTRCPAPRLRPRPRRVRARAAAPACLRRLSPTTQSVPRQTQIPAPAPDAASASRPRRRQRTGPATGWCCTRPRPCPWRAPAPCATPATAGSPQVY